MDTLSTGERLEIEFMKFRAEMDQRFARMDQQFVDVQQAIRDDKLKAAGRFNRGTIWVAAATISASVVSAGAAIALAVAFG